ncbi:glycosyltransferase [Thiocapsa roseopersicina]|uniref:glycosyltransferase n=1 Tax=Thiocapsa roseopersicina TaxID=1058 RepID=UPI0015873712|nr:glycosyltransferase [Thiocapsa roseopersicina]
MGSGSVLVVAASPGDEVFGCGGACRRHSEAGEDVHVLVVTDGYHGVSDPVVQAEMRRNLESECHSAAQVLEYHKPLFWKESPTAIEYGERMVSRLAQLVAETGARLVYAPSVYDPDPTRSVLGMIAREAVRRMSIDCVLAVYEVEVPLQPTHFLDITDVFDLKQAAMACFVSRPDMQSRCEQIAALNRLRAYMLPQSVKAAEGLTLVRAEDLSRPVAGTSTRLKSWTECPSDRPLVSVVIRSANRPELADALDSIATQTYRHIEVILVDVEGQGTLMPEPWCGQFPLRTASTGAHLGRGAAANVGIMAATGHYVVFLDDDDWFLPDHVACLVAALQRSNTARVAYCGIECRRRNEAGDWEVVHVFNEPHDATRLLIENYLPIHAVLFERSLVDDELRFEETLNVYEDWDFWVQLSTRSNFVHVDRITAVYRIASTSGFGVRTTDPELQSSLATFFARWRARWSIEQVIAIAGYTKHQVARARDDSRQYRAEVQSELDSLQAKVAAQAALEQTVEELQETLRARETRIANLEVATDGRLTNLGRLSAALATCQARLGKLEADNAEQSARIHDLSDTLSDTLADNKRAITELQASLRASTAQLVSARSELDSGRERIHELKGILSACDAKGAGLERALAAARNTASATESQRQKLLTRVAALQTSASWSLNGRLMHLEQRLPGLTRAAFAVARATWWTLTLSWRQALRRRARARRILASGLFDETWYAQRYPDVLLCGYRPIFHWLAVGAREGRDPNPLFDGAWYLARSAAGKQTEPDPLFDPLLDYLDHGARSGTDPHPLFDSRWYIEKNPEVADRGANPLADFIRNGTHEDRDPHPLFDVDWYLAQNPDVAAAGINPLVHFIEQGADEGRDPHPLFRIDWYRDRNPEVAAAGVNPLIHFIAEGALSGCDPHPLFRIPWYFERNPDVGTAGANPLIHFVTRGMAQGMDPHVLFDGAWYRATNPDVAQAGIAPFIHYVCQGWTESRNPHPLFDITWYLEHNPDVREAGIDPFAHYLEAGAFEGRDPCPLFDTDWYRSENPDILDANPLYHYLTAGAAEGRRPHPLFDSAWYLREYPEVATSGRNPLVDYLIFGADEGRNPGPEFDTLWYRTTYPDTRCMNPLVHYVIAGAAEGRLPRPDAIETGRADGTSARDTLAIASPPATGSGIHWQHYWEALLPTQEVSPQRVLVIDWKPPTPDRDSGSYRMHMILELLREADQEVDFIADRPAEDTSYARALTRNGISVVVGHEAAISHLRSNGGRYRAVWISRPELAEIYLPIVRAFAVKARVIYDTVDLHWIRFERGIPFDDHPERLTNMADRYRRIELSNAQAADLTIAITPEEKRALLAQDPQLHVEILPNVHRLCACVTPASARQDLFFIGGFSHRPNVDAVIYFVRDILPLIHEQQAGIRFNIIGSDMPEEIHALASALVNPVGYVPDVTAWFEQSRVFVSPLRHGAGMKGKIGQSLSHGLPVVTTRIGAEGMGLTNEIDALIADDPRRFAQSVLRLYTDDSLWHRMSAAGQELIERHYSKEAVLPMLLPLVS